MAEGGEGLCLRFFSFVLALIPSRIIELCMLLFQYVRVYIQDGKGEQKKEIK